MFQFTVSVCLILGAIIIWRQLDFLKQQQLGFNKEQKLILPLQQGFNNSEQNFTALKNGLMKIPGVNSVTSGSTYPGIQNLSDMLFFAEHKTKADVVDIHLSAIGPDYLKTLGMQLLSGRTFSDDFRSDSAGIILNETAVRQLGYTPTSAIGKTIRYEFSHFQGAMSVIGVVKDFNFESLHTGIKRHGLRSGMFGK